MSDRHLGMAAKAVEFSIFRRVGTVIAKPDSMFTILFSIMFSVFAVGIVVMILELKKAPIATQGKDGFRILPSNSPQYRLAPVKSDSHLEAAILLKKSHSTR